MRIADMIPYERNAWDNAAGVPAIAESIREFGFRGKIKPPSSCRVTTA